MGRNPFNEDSRVKIPVILQLVRLGYDFVPTALRFAASMLCRERLRFFLKLGIAYVYSENDGAPRLEKHIMRYPQYFASVKIRKSLSHGF